VGVWRQQQFHLLGHQVEVQPLVDPPNQTLRCTLRLSHFLTRLHRLFFFSLLFLPSPCVRSCRVSLPVLPAIHLQPPSPLVQLVSVATYVLQLAECDDVTGEAVACSGGVRIPATFLCTVRPRPWRTSVYTAGVVCRVLVSCQRPKVALDCSPVSACLWLGSSHAMSPDFQCKRA
jgi:hypothetical protein